MCNRSVRGHSLNHLAHRIDNLRFRRAVLLALSAFSYLFHPFLLLSRFHAVPVRMSLTGYQAKYFPYQLTKRSPLDSMEKLAGAVASAQVDLNPHQVDAALFAFRSPLSKGALLADEVGLGKTIDAGLVFSQKWAERKRRVLIILPSNLRKQWYPSQLCLLSRKSLSSIEARLLPTLTHSYSRRVYVDHSRGPVLAPAT